MKRLWLALFLLLTPLDSWPCDDSLAVVLDEDAIEVGVDVAESYGGGSGGFAAERNRAAREAARQVLREAELAKELSDLDQLGVLSRGEPDEQTLKKVVPARPDALIIIQNGNGTIRLIGWSRPEVAINCTLDRNLAVLRAYGRLDSSEIRIEVEPRSRVLRAPPGRQPIVIDDRRSTGRSPHVSTVPPVPRVAPTPAVPPTRPVPAPAPVARPGPSPWVTPMPEPDSEDPEDLVEIGPLAPEANLEIYVPRQARLNLETFGADVATESLEGTIDLKSLQGDMKLDGRFRRVDAECVSCDMEIGPVQETLRVSNIAGSVSAQRLTGLAEVSTVSGDMELNALGLGTGNFSSINGNIAFTGSVLKEGALFFETHSGSVDLNLARGICAEFDLTTLMGQLSTGLNARESEDPSRRAGRRVRFVTCGGGARVSAKSFSGDITVNEVRR